MNYIDAVIQDKDREIILEEFYLEPLKKQTVDRYTVERLSYVARKLFTLLEETPTEAIIDIIEANKEKIPPLSTRDIPMFSDLKAVDIVPGIAESNPGASFPVIGSIMLPNNRAVNQRKWGETHLFNDVLFADIHSDVTPKTGDDRNPLIWLLLLGIGGCMAGAAWYLRKKDEKDQNQD